MRIIKRLVSAMLVGAFCFGLINTGSYAGVRQHKSYVGIQPIEKHITDPEEIKEYLHSQGEAYDENLVEVVQYIYPDLENKKTDFRHSDDPQIWEEWFTTNLSVYTYTDWNYLLKEYSRPAGKVSINESVSITNKIEVSGKVKAQYVEAALSVSTSETNTFSINWENTYSYPVTIKVYPKYEVKSGDLWEDDVWYDDYYGHFTFYRAIGDDVRVYKR